MPTDKLNRTYERPTDHPTYSSVLREIGQTAKDLIRSEVHLMNLELTRAIQKLTRHSAQAAIFGSLMVLSIFPFLAFLVIGLGELLEGRYWLSSLIVAVICAAIGGFFADRAFKKIKDEDLDLSHTKSTFNREMAALQDKVNEIKTAARGERHSSHHIHH